MLYLQKPTNLYKRKKKDQETMDFSTIPSAYLDPANWHQQQNFQSGSGGSNNPHLPPPPPPPQLPGPPPPPQPHGGGAGSIRPGSMVDRARMANIPLPETALKCPRCESTNTKFCYFNNYSLTQPRHFCKTCRRYWTRGGALRNVPVGGGCRRNKRTKGSNSKSPASSGDIQSTTSASTSTTLALPISGTTTANILGLTSQFPQLRFMAPLGQLSGEFGEIGLNYGGGGGGGIGGGLSGPMEPNTEMNFQNLFGGGGGGSSGGIEPWRLQQFPFMGGLDPVAGSGGPTGLYQFQGGSELNSQIGSVKMEENNSNLSRQLLGVNVNIQGNNDQWRSTTTSGNVNAWTDISGGFSSSSTSNPL